VTQLRQIMLEELERRNYASGTIRSYIRTVEHIQVLKRFWSTSETPYPKKVLHLPQVLSQQEVARLIDAAQTPFHRILLMTLYATGARRAEVAHLKISDIDSQRMVVHLQGGKGRKDRDVMLSPALLEALRIHWRGLRHKPTTWLFPGGQRHTASRPIDTKVLWWACKYAAQRAGLEHRHIHPHTLRHYSACRTITGNFAFVLFSASSLAAMRHSLAPPIHRDRRKGVRL
jgi:integrase/recombinase XerD